jgi:hypothetical protein
MPTLRLLAAWTLKNGTPFSMFSADTSRDSPGLARQHGCHPAVHGQTPKRHDRRQMASRCVGGRLISEVSTTQEPVWRAILLIWGNNHRRLSFSSARFPPKGCTAGDQWVCDLLDALSHPKPANDIQTPDIVKNDVNAILRDVNMARSAPRIGYPFVPPIAVDLQI